MKETHGNRCRPDDNIKIARTRLRDAINEANLSFIQTDVSIEQQVQGLIRGAADKCGLIDILVNCAGVELAKKGTNATAEEWDRLMAINLKGVFLCSKAAISQMARTGGGVIVNVASELGLVGVTRAQLIALQRAELSS